MTYRLWKGIFLVLLLMPFSMQPLFGDPPARIPMGVVEDAGDPVIAFPPELVQFQEEFFRLLSERGFVGFEEYNAREDIVLNADADFDEAYVLIMSRVTDPSASFEAVVESFAEDISWMDLPADQQLDIIDLQTEVGSAVLKVDLGDVYCLVSGVTFCMDVWQASPPERERSFVPLAMNLVEKAGTNAQMYCRDLAAYTECVDDCKDQYNRAMTLAGNRLQGCVENCMLTCGVAGVVACLASLLKRGGGGLWLGLAVCGCVLLACLYTGLSICANNYDHDKTAAGLQYDWCKDDCYKKHCSVKPVQGDPQQGNPVP